LISIIILTVSVQMLDWSWLLEFICI